MDSSCVSPLSAPPWSNNVTSAVNSWLMPKCGSPLTDRWWQTTRLIAARGGQCVRWKPLSQRALGERSPTSRLHWPGCGPAGMATAACAVRTSSLSCSRRFPRPLCAWRASTPPIARPSRAAGPHMAGFRRADGMRDLHIGGGGVEQARHQFCGGSLAGNDSRPQSSTMSLSREAAAAATLGSRSFDGARNPGHWSLIEAAAGGCVTGSRLSDSRRLRRLRTPSRPARRAASDCLENSRHLRAAAYGQP